MASIPLFLLNHRTFNQKSTDKHSSYYPTAYSMIHVFSSERTNPSTPSLSRYRKLEWEKRFTPFNNLEQLARYVRPVSLAKPFYHSFIVVINIQTAQSNVISFIHADLFPDRLSSPFLFWCDGASFCAQLLAGRFYLSLMRCCAANYKEMVKFSP